MQPDVIVVGAGIFGVTAALELHRRGHRTLLLDPGPLPHPEAASTDISKVIRMEYGADIQYMEMMEATLKAWRTWDDLEEPLFHETGVTMFTKGPMVPGGYEYESYRLLLARGHAPERLDGDEIHRRFPAWRKGAFVDGFYHKQGGYAQSGRVVDALLQRAARAGVVLHAGTAAAQILTHKSRVRGVKTVQGDALLAPRVVVAAGAWTPWLVPDLAPIMQATGHPVFHLEVPRPTRFTPPHFTVFMADVAQTGWYGFPVHPTAGVIKVANHGVGVKLHPAHDPRVVTPDDEVRLRRFLADTFPDLAEARITYTRRCLYCDTADEHFWIDHHPDYDGLVVASGGSGHGFKFAPILGTLIADALEQKPNLWLHKFRWRHLGPETRGEEAARHHGATTL